MSLSPLPLSYCTNVHPGRTIAEVDAGLDRYTVPVKHAFGQPLAAGLWLARSVVTELLQSPQALAAFSQGLENRGLTCHTLNAFPYGDFHSPRVKENVYLPDWTNPARSKYTLDCAQVLAALLPDRVEGSISTLPLGFKGFKQPEDFLDRAADALIQAARDLSRVREQSGRLIRLAIEPEPFCVLETTPEAISFFQRLHRRAGGEVQLVKEHLGLCYDVCHQAVEFEEISKSIQDLHRHDIRINKVHISCAIAVKSLSSNAEAREALQRYVEPRYLHQTLSRSASGQLFREIDLSEELINHPPALFASADEWRVHFHVPVNRQSLGPLGTTYPSLVEALQAVARLPYAPHLEVETYTWEVLPGGPQVDLVEGLSAELTATHRLLQSIA